MTVYIWGTDNNGLKPRVTVYDARYRPVEAVVLVNEGGSYTIQLPNANEKLSTSKIMPDS